MNDIQIIPFLKCFSCTYNSLDLQKRRSKLLAIEFDDAIYPRLRAQVIQ